MNTTTIKLITIIAEGVLKDRLIDAILKRGAKGYTLSEVHGHGSRGISASFWDGAQVRIETLVSPAVAEKILQHLSDEYFKDYAVVAYAENVEVVRGEKYM
ncbi:MAG: transcriptional regulator [Chloroflexaceae bacterium]|nr:transcriptional regulator [Chloroflexaceae bacterium]